MAWQWYDTHNQIADVKHELAGGMADVADAWGKESHTQEAVRGKRTEAKLGLLKARIANRRASNLALEELYRELQLEIGTRRR